MNVALVCTTDDPVDSLEHHIRLKKDGFEIPILPAFRPDQAMNVSSAVNFNNYVKSWKKQAGSPFHLLMISYMLCRTVMIFLHLSVVKYLIMGWKRSMLMILQAPKLMPFFIRYIPEKN
jgi:hypothetical protein